ncbi:hypothetical protein XBKQ1_2790019 [Xenorhabdus bovienii str. kraussei Quebec]|uniref:Uncharacterized protein n=1 Tax=Xenorhabdus bovienii str. kraussei Quebec TaxID=1398203 RepID=A0A077PJM5_XENBV|nr:hypothetical protein XBKQ1_2790019 [Xenorhabdus bovienii str. kraussei Quebec]
MILNQDCFYVFLSHYIRHDKLIYRYDINHLSIDDKSKPFKTPF